MKRGRLTPSSAAGTRVKGLAAGGLHAARMQGSTNSSREEVTHASACGTVMSLDIPTYRIIGRGETENRQAAVKLSDTSSERDDQAVAERHPPVHAARRVEIVGGDQGRELRMRGRSRRASSKTRSAVSGSRLPVGSSARSRRGALATARAMATRCCSPPESSAGRCSSALAEAQERRAAARRARVRLASRQAADQLRHARRSRAPRTPAADGGTGRRSRSRRGGARCARHRRMAGRRHAADDRPRRRRAVRAGRRYAAASICRRRRARPAPPISPGQIARSAPRSTSSELVALRVVPLDRRAGTARVAAAPAPSLIRSAAPRPDRAARRARRDRASPAATAPAPSPATVDDLARVHRRPAAATRK